MTSDGGKEPSRAKGWHSGVRERLKRDERVGSFLLAAAPNYHKLIGFPGGSVVKNLPVSAGDVGLILGSGRSPGEGNSNPLQYSCLEIPWTEECGGLQSMVSK